MRPLHQRGERGGEGADPVEVVAPGPLGTAQQIGRELVVLRIVLDQEHADHVVGARRHRSDSTGKATSSNQYLPSVLATWTSPSKLTGLVMNELAPRS